MKSKILSILGDLKKLYVNFGHWLGSKLVIHIVSFILGVVFSLPFFIVLIIVGLLSPIDWTGILQSIFLSSPMLYDTVSQLFSHPFVFILIGILVFFVMFAFIVGYSYTNFSFARINLSYIAGEKLPILGMHWFKKEQIVMYVQVFLWSLLILLIPVVLGGIIISVLFFIFSGSFSLSEFLSAESFNLFSILSGGVAILCFGVFLYLSYRILFSYFYYIDAPKKHAGARHYIAKSWRHTSSWKVLSGLILVLIGYLAITLPLGMVGENFQLKKQELEQYYVYVNSSEQDQQILASSTEPNYYESLALDYGYLDNESMISRYNRDNFFEIVFQILYFMLWYGVLEMLVASYYTHVISHVKAPASKKKKEV